MEAKQEDDDGDDKEGEYESTHDDDPDAHTLSSTNENYCKVRKIIIIVDTIHGYGQFNNLS